MYLIRRVDEKLIELYPQNEQVKSPVHLSIGQEGAAIACLPLRKQDAVFGSYRSHALYVAKGGDLKAFFAEMMGKVTGCCKGKGGSMHLCDPEVGVMGTSAVVGSTIPEAVGWAYAAKLQGKNAVALSFFGDGATDEGVFYESVNFAIVKKVPVIFVCENNGLAIHSRLKSRSFSKRIIERFPKRLDMRVFSAKSYEVEKIYDIVNENLSLMLMVSTNNYSYPIFLEIETYRMYEHVGINTDWQLGYRNEKEAKEFIDNDPLLAKLPENMKKRVDAKIEEAVKFAEKSPFPDKRELYADLF
jgi:TPP-dependent pyruvate/acetoin dehydrogenase alpha subunit